LPLSSSEISLFAFGGQADQVFHQIIDLAFGSIQFINSIILKKGQALNRREPAFGLGRISRPG
jgi:hypothetical protein